MVIFILLGILVIEWLLIVCSVVMGIGVLCSGRVLVGEIRCFLLNKFMVLFFWKLVIGVKVVIRGVFVYNNYCE